jgi:PAS domain S-box-containing protein
VKDRKRTRADLISELARLRQRIAELEAVAAIEREHGDEGLRRSEATYRDLYENAPNAYFSVTASDGSIRKCNHAASRLLGYDTESLTRMNVLDLYADTPHGVPEAQNVFKRFRDGLPVRDVELQMKHKNGDPIWISLSIEPVRDREGNIAESRSMVIDVSERKEAQARIASAKEELDRTFDAVPDLVMILDNKHRIVRANKAMADSLACSPEELVGQTCYEVVHASEEPPHFCPHAKVLIDGQEHSAEVPGDRLDGHFLVSVSPLHGDDGEVVGGVHVARDITQRKQVEEALRRSERETSIMKRIAEIFLTTSDDKTYGDVLEIVLEEMGSEFGTFAYIDEDGNRVVPSMTKGIWDKCEVQSKAIVFPPDTWGDNLWARCLINKTAFSSNGPFKVPDGHIPITRALAVPIIHQGKAIGNFMVGNKLTDYDERDEELLRRIAFYTAPILHARLERDRQHTKRKHAEEALRKAHSELEQHVEDRTAVLMRTVKRLKKEVKDRRQAEKVLAETQQRYRTVADFTYDWEYWLGPEKDLLYVSPSCERITGYLPEEFLTKDYGELMKIVHPDDRKDVKAHITEEFESDEACHLDFRIITRFGETRWISHYCQPVSGPDRERLGRRASNRDITGRKKGEEALHKSEMQLRRLSTQLLKVQESERKRIAGDLHDGIGQSLSAIKFGVETVVDRLEKEADPSIVDTLQSLIPMLQDAIEDVRKTVMNLRPSMLDDLGVMATISWFVRQFQAVYSGIRVEEQIDVRETEIPEVLKTNIFRVLQEAANNIAKHSSADRVRVSLNKKSDSLELVIQDNGRGFDPGGVLETEDIETGFGITSMKERTELSGGSFSIESAKGAGTTIRAVWPRRS